MTAVRPPQRERKKTPEGTVKARRRHLNLQGRRDALAKLAAGETVVIWASDGKKFECVRVKPVGEIDPMHLSVLVVMPRKKVPLTGELADKNGCVLHTNGACYRVDYTWVRGILVTPENDERQKHAALEKERFDAMRYKAMSWLTLNPVRRYLPRSVQR